MNRGYIYNILWENGIDTSYVVHRVSVQQVEYLINALYNQVSPATLHGFFGVFFESCFFMCPCPEGSKTHTHNTHTHASIDLRITVRWILLGLLATARGVQFLTEQPGSSLMPMLCYFQFVAMIIRPVTWNSVKLLDAQWMGIEPSP